MASTTAQLKIQIQADLTNAKAELEAINKQVASIDPTAQVTAQALREVDSSLLSLSGVVMGVTAAFLSLQTAMAAIQVSDDYNQMASRLKMATQSAEEYELVQRKIMETADRTYKPLAEQQELFIRSSSSMKEMGYSTQETLKFLDSVSSSLTINSASADKFARANDAISKAMVSGKLSGLEWQAVMQTMPTAIQDIADHLGITESAVKQMAAEGKLSIGQFVDAMNAVQQKNAELAEKMPTTFGDAMTKLKNHLSAYLGETNKSIGASEKLVEAINFVTKHLDMFAKVITALVAGGLARYGVMLLQNTLVTIKASAAKKALAAQELALAEAQVAATRAALTEAAGHAQSIAAAKAHQAALVQLATAQRAVSTGMFSLGLPGLAMTVASVAAGFLLFKDNTETVKEALVDLNISLDESIEKFRQLDSASSRNAAIANTKKTVSELKKEYQDLLVQIHTLDTGLFKPVRFTDAQGFNDLLIKLNEARNPLQGQKADWDKLSESIASSSAITEQYKNSLLSLVGKLKEKDEEIQKGIELAKQQEVINNELSDQDKAQAQAKRDFINSASALNDKIKKLTGSIDSNITSSRSSADMISLLESQIANLKNTAGATPEKINEITQALDKLKVKQQELNDINNNKTLTNLKKQNATTGMSNWDKQRYEITNDPTWSDEKRKEALAEIAQAEAKEKAAKAAEKAKSAAESLTKANLSYVQSLEKQRATMNLGKVATLEYEIAEKKLSGALLERAHASVEALKAAQQLANAKNNSSMQIELLRLTGNDYQANLLELESKFKETTANLKKEGNEAGIKLAQELFEAGKAKAQLDKVKAEVDKIFANQSRQEQSIQAQVEAGLITQYQAQKNLTDLHAQTAASVKKYLPELEKAARMPGAMGEQSKAYLVDVNNQLLILQKTTSELENAFRNGLQDGIQSSIDGLVRGTMNLQEALKNFVDTIASNILNVVAQNIAKQATEGIMGGLGSLDSFFGFGASTQTDLGVDQSTPEAAAISSASQEGAMAMQLGIEQGAITAAQTISSALSSLGAINGGLGGEAGLFGNITEQATEAVGAINTVKATKTAADATLTASATSAAATTTATNTAAASAASAQWAAPAAEAATASFGTAAMIGLSALMMVMTALKAFNTGGHVQGPGTGTSDSIPAMLSNDEFVTRAAVVRQPGMLAFMKDLNKRGWGAVSDLQRVKHSTGGLAGQPANHFSAPLAPTKPDIGTMQPSALENINNNSTTLTNNQQFVMVDDPKKMGDAILNNEHTQESFFIFLQNQNQKVKSSLQIG